MEGKREVVSLLDLWTFKADPSLNDGRIPEVNLNEGLNTRKWP